MGVPFAPGYNLPYQENGRDRVQWRVIVELSSTVGAEQVYEVHVGGNAGIVTCRGQVGPGRPAAPSCSDAIRGALPGPATLPSMWGTAAAEGSVVWGAAAHQGQAVPAFFVFVRYRECFLARFPDQADRSTLRFWTVSSVKSAHSVSSGPIGVAVLNRTLAAGHPDSVSCLHVIE